MCDDRSTFFSQELSSTVPPSSCASSLYSLRIDCGDRSVGEVHFYSPYQDGGKALDSYMFFGRSLPVPVLVPLFSLSIYQSELLGGVCLSSVLNYLSPLPVVISFLSGDGARSGPHQRAYLSEL